MSNDDVSLKILDSDQNLVKKEPLKQFIKTLDLDQNLIKKESVKQFIKILDSEQLLSEKDALQLFDVYKGDALSVMGHLLRKGAVKKRILGRIWGDSIGIAYVDLNKMIFQSQVVAKLPEKFALNHRIIPLNQFGQHATVAASDPLNAAIIKEAEKLMGMPVSAVFSFPDDIEDAIHIQYQSKISIERYIEKIPANILFKDIGSVTSDQLKRSIGEQSVINFTNAFLLNSVKERASDIHIEPLEDFARVRFRIDSVLQEQFILEKPYYYLLGARLKFQAKLDMSEWRRPQEGRLNLSLANKIIEFIFATVPTICGEKIVLRILNQIQVREIPDLTELNFSKSTLTGLKKVMKQNSGIFFVTGPPTSGKTTTLFALLKYLNRPEVNIMTIEDTIEYRLTGVNQVQTSRILDFNMSSALRSFLKQDPDVIMIEEIGDAEIAQLAIKAALTGHLVLSSMHTNNAHQLLTRLLETGLDTFLVAPSVIGVMAQRLARKICGYCKQRYLLNREETDGYFIGADNKQVYFYRGTGCSDCNYTGYSGRIAIHELLIITKEIRDLFTKGASMVEIEKSSRKSGFKTIHYDGMKKVLRGLTTIEELERIAGPEENGQPQK